MAAVVFWAALGVVVYVYAGYPILIAVLARLRPRSVQKGPELPTVSFIVAAYNEQDAIADKLRNTLAIDYPPEKLEIIVASDGSTDRTDEIVRTEFAERVKLVGVRKRQIPFTLCLMNWLIALDRLCQTNMTGDSNLVPGKF